MHSPYFYFRFLKLTQILTHRGIRGYVPWSNLYESRLATVVRGSIDRTTLAKVMKLRPDEKIILAQSVGYPKK
jgi:hypothetical protein